MDWKNRHVTVMGLGRHGGGVSAARYVATAGAIVTVTDLLSQEELAESIAQLADIPIAKFRFGPHDCVDFQQAEVLIVNPAVPPRHPLVALAESSGALVTTELEIFLRNCPARIVAVTGSNGKSTTTTMLAEILQQAGHQVWLGGNIGRSLLLDLPQMSAEDVVALEVSSFQLAQLSGSGQTVPELRCIDCAIVTNCQPNHLDWHGTLDDYQAAKERLLTLVRPQGTVVLNPLAAELASWKLPSDVSATEFAQDSLIPELNLLGTHNRENSRCAASAAISLGGQKGDINIALQNFRGLPHRLELIGEVGGRKFYNDSMATTPEAVVRGLRAMNCPVWLLAGGKDKGSDLVELTTTIYEFAQGVCFYGAAKERFSAALDAHQTQMRQAKNLRQTNLQSTAVETLAEAVKWCFARSKSGDAILLSPGCSSYDQYQDYAARAAHFLQLMIGIKQSE